jgi:hypothetical protein
MTGSTFAAYRAAGGAVALDRGFSSRCELRIAEHRPARLGGLKGVTRALRD